MTVQTRRMWNTFQKPALIELALLHEMTYHLVDRLTQWHRRWNNPLCSQVLAAYK